MVFDEIVALITADYSLLFNLFALDYIFKKMIISRQYFHGDKKKLIHADTVHVSQTLLIIFRLSRNILSSS